MNTALKRIGLGGAALVMWLASSGPLFAASGSWNVDSDGNWNVNGNWSGATFPDGAAQQATLGNVITADRVITLGQNIVIRNLVVNDDNRYTITGANTLTLNRAGTQFTQSGSGGVTIESDVVLGNSGTWGGTGSGTAVFDGDISDGGSGYQITKGGSYTLILNGDNTFSGGMVLNAGTVEFGSDTAAGTGTLDLSGSTVQAGGGARTLDNAITLTGTTTVEGSNDLTFTGDAVMTASRNVVVNGSGVVTFSGDISDGGSGYRLTKDGAGTLVLGGNNTYSGNLRILDGTLDFGHNNAAGTGDLLINGAATLRASGGSRTISNTTDVNSDFTIGGSNDLTISGDMTLGAAIRTVTVNNTGSTTFSGVISETGGLTKAGSGTLTLSGGSANTFSGATTINAGTLELAKSGALGSTSSVTVNSGGTLLFSGGSTDRISNTAGMTLAGGLLSANNATETMGALTLSADSVINLVGDGTNGTLTWASASRTGGILTINNWQGSIGGPGTGDRIFITANPGSAFFDNILFTGLLPGGATAPGYWLSTGEIVPLPEPGTVGAGVLLALLMAAGAIRRMRRC